MSQDNYTMVPDWLMWRTDFSSTEKLCYARMHRYCADKGYGWASQQTIANQLGCEVRQIGRCVRRLLQEGLLVLKSPARGSTFPTVFRTLTPEKFLREFTARQAPYGGKLDRLGAELLVDSSSDKKSDEVGLDVLGERTSCPTSSDKKSRKDTTQETSGRNNEEDNLHVERSSTLREGGSVTQECFPAAEGLSPELNYAADPVSLPQPPVPEIVSQAAPEFVVGDPLMEDEMSKPEVQARLARAKLAGDKGFDATVRVKQKKEKDRAEKAARALKEGEPVKVRAPKEQWVSKVLLLQDVWISEYRRKFPNDPIAAKWNPQQGLKAKGLLQSYALEDVERAVRYFLRHWEVHQPRFFKGKVHVPTLGVFCSLHETLLPESKRMFFALKAKADYEAWAKANPDEVMPPEDLQKQYNAALPALKSLGL